MKQDLMQKIRDAETDRIGIGDLEDWLQRHRFKLLTNSEIQVAVVDTIMICVYARRQLIEPGNLKELLRHQLEVLRGT